MRYWRRRPRWRSLVDRTWSSLRNNHARRGRQWRCHYGRRRRTRRNHRRRRNRRNRRCGGRRHYHGRGRCGRRNHRRRRQSRWPGWHDCRWSRLSHRSSGPLDRGSHDHGLGWWRDRSHSGRRNWRCRRRRRSRHRRHDHRPGDHRRRHRRRCRARRRRYRFFLLGDGFEHVSGTGDVRQINLGLDFFFAA